MTVPRRRLLRLGVFGLAGTILASCSSAPAPTAQPPERPAATSPPASAATSAPTATPKPAPTAAPTAVIGKLEQTTGKMVLIAGLFDNVFSRMGLQKGFFKAAGIDVEFVDVTGGPVLQSALINGEADIVELGTTVMTVPIEKGVPIKIVGVSKPRQNMLFYARKDINSIADLYGRSIGTGAPGAPVYVVVQALFDKYKADPGKVELVNLGSSSAVGQGLLVGKVDAGPAGIELLPQIEASRELKVLYNLADEIPDFIRTVIGATEKTIKEKPNLLAALLTAYSRGVRYAIENRQEAIALANSLFPGGGQAVESSYDWHVKNKIMNPNLDLSTDEYKRFQQLMVRLGLQTKELPYEQVMDLTAQKKVISVLGQYTYK